MKILYDHQIFYQRYGGASKYFVMLLNSLPKDIWSTTTLLSCNEYVNAKKLFYTTPFYFKGQAKIFNILNKIYSTHCILNGRYDIFHQTDFDTYFIDSLKNKPMVTTFHDVNFSLHDPHPDLVKKQKKSLERADAIITISNNTKNDMLNIFDIDEGKVHVIYHGVEKPVMSDLQYDKIFDFDYILYVGSRSKYKNFNRFIQAFSRIHRIFPNVKVVCTGHPFKSHELQKFHDLGIYNSMINISANELDMQRLYRDALFFIFPSVYEGFGMPILEAWACNCPVLLSNSSCFPEIAGDAGLYFNPYEIDEIFETMLKFINDSDLRKELLEKGHERIVNYSWEDSAKKHLDVYNSLV